MLTCPYCNAQVTQPSSLSVGDRVHCPRCEESFLYRPSSTTTLAAPAAVPVAAETEPPAGIRPLPRWAAQLAALSFLVLLASTLLKFALPDNNTTQHAFPFMLILSSIGLVA